MTTTGSAPSNTHSTGVNLQARGILWRIQTTEEIETISKEEFSFANEWEKLASESGSSMPAEHAWNYFKPVMTNMYKNEKAFDVALFKALGEALSDVIKTPASDPNAIELKEYNVGFQRQAARSLTMFPSNYGASGESVFDHVCLVFKNRLDIKSPLHPLNDQILFDECDFTAVVKLKFNLNEFVTINRTVIKAPDLMNKHGALGQALVHTLDTWHCLARRGITVDKLPVVVLACKHENNVSRICCVDASLHIPEHTGTVFYYTINRHFFHLSKDEINDQQVIAVYLRAMQSGLKKAKEIAIQRKNERVEYPVSLCCRTLKVGAFDISKNAQEVELVASPIPKAARRNTLSIRQGEQSILKPASIYQGELFVIRVCDNIQLSSFGDGYDVYYFAAKETILPQNILVKVSCRSVHNTLVEPFDCHRALQDIGTRDNDTLKAKIAEVLLVSIFINRYTLITVMRNLSKSESVPFGELSPRSIHKNHKLKALWEAFHRLVVDVLLPMAELDIIHDDIRPRWTSTYNILYREMGEEVELRLIDYESLHLVPSAMKALWWQVLWVAFNWYGEPKHIAVDNDNNKIDLYDLDTFNFGLFRNFYSLFQEACVAEKWNEIRHYYSHNLYNADSITHVLKNLSDLF